MVGGGRGGAGSVCTGTGCPGPCPQLGCGREGSFPVGWCPPLRQPVQGAVAAGSGCAQYSWGAVLTVWSSGDALLAQVRVMAPMGPAALLPLGLRPPTSAGSGPQGCRCLPVGVSPGVPGRVIARLGGGVGPLPQNSGLLWLGRSDPNVWIRVLPSCARRQPAAEPLSPSPLLTPCQGLLGWVTVPS